MALLRDLIEAVLFPDREIHGIPVLDGAFSPNQRLEQGRVLGDEIDAPDDLAAAPDGALYVSSRGTILRCTGGDFTVRTPFARSESDFGGLAWSADGHLLACVSGRGLCALMPDGRTGAWLEAVDGVPLHCATAVATAKDGTVYVTDGSRHNPPERWLHDLMQNRPGTGRLIACSADLAGARVLADGLSWPCGVAVSHGETEILVTEAWTHALSAVPRSGGVRQMRIRNFAGYPARIAPGNADDYWLAFFALRSHLTEFVLREPAFRRKMMAQVPPELWIGPSLMAKFNYREPTQIGRIKKLGIQKPWAPARSYGLVARLDAAGDAVESWHSRVAGSVHGVTSVRTVGSRVIAVSKGNNRLVELPTSKNSGS